MSSSSCARIEMVARGKRDMEFVSRKKCIEYYESQYPELPRYMIEMALDYDLAQGEGSSSNEKPMTNIRKGVLDLRSAS